MGHSCPFQTGSLSDDVTQPSHSPLPSIIYKAELVTFVASNQGLFNVLPNGAGSVLIYSCFK